MRPRGTECSAALRGHWRAHAAAAGRSAGGRPDGPLIAVVGATGGTGVAATQGLLLGSAGTAARMRLLTRDPGSARARSLVALSPRAGAVELARADLDAGAIELAAALEGADAVYIHALGADEATADVRELSRARELARALCMAGARRVCYNSAGGGENGMPGVSQAEQKRAVEGILSETCGDSLHCVHLRATLFMEELWKDYTRPAILREGVFSFALPADRKVQLVSVLDMGRAAARVLCADKDDAPAAGSAVEGATTAVEIAGDELSMTDLAQAFERAQAGVAGCAQAVRHRRFPAWPVWLLNRDLYRIIAFYRDVGYEADVRECRARFDVLSFEDSLEATHWEDRRRSYGTTGVEYDLSVLCDGGEA